MAGELPRADEPRRGLDPASLQRRLSLGAQGKRNVSGLSIPKGLSKSEHMRCAIQLLNSEGHPFARSPPLRPHWEAAIKTQISFHELCRNRSNRVLGNSECPLPCEMLIQLRKTAMAKIRVLARQLEPQRKQCLARMHPEVRMVAGHLHLPLFEALLRDTNFPNLGLPAQISKGRPIVGTPLAGGALLSRSRPAAESIETLKGHDFSLENLRTIRKVGAGSGDPLLDAASFERTQREFTKGTLAGPFADVGELLAALTRSLGREVTFGEVLVSPQFPVWENHGSKVRNITNMKGTANMFVGLNESYIPDGIEGLASICQTFNSYATQFPVFKGKFLGFPSDYEGAYRQVPIEPSHYRFAVTAFFNPTLGIAQLAYFRSCPFGGSLAPNNWAEVCYAMSWVAGMLLAIPCTTCVDDTSTAELGHTARSAYDSWLELNELTGWRVDSTKTPPPACAFRSLGVWAALPHLEVGQEFTAQLLEERADRLVLGLREVQQKGTLTPAEAGKWRGRLFFATSVGWFGAARAQLAPFAARQYGRDSTDGSLNHELNHLLSISLQFFVTALKSQWCLLPRGFPNANLPLFLSYSGGEGAGGVGGVLLPRAFRTKHGSLEFDSSLPRYFSSVLPSEAPGQFGIETLDLAHITAIESAAVLLTLHTFENLREGLWFHFVDNESALGSIIKGNSPSMVMNGLAALIHEECAVRRLYLYVQYVDSAANPADPPSRGSAPPEDPWNRGWQRCEARFPERWPSAARTPPVDAGLWQ